MFDALARKFFRRFCAPRRKHLVRVMVPVPFMLMAVTAAVFMLFAVPVVMSAAMPLLFVVFVVMSAVMFMLFAVPVVMSAAAVFMTFGKLGELGL